jgi:hypothetical protein
MAARLQPNLLSRAPRKYTPRFFANGRMVAIDLRYIAENKADYARIFNVWGRLVAREPYYHVHQDGDADASGRRVKRHAFAQHLDPKQCAELSKITNSQVPVVTIDWFFVMTSVEADRDSVKGGKFVGTGYGYYDFLGLKSRDDFFKLAGVNLKENRSDQSELLAVVLGHNSGVAQNDRMVVRRAATDGFAWFTLDFFDNNLDERNPLLFLDPTKGLKHQAERHFATLPNGLPVMLVCDQNGELAETAPDKIGPDTTARGKDTRIHCAKSCISCHNNGFLKDINDEVRQIYRFEPTRGYNLLTAPLKEEEIRLHDRYLRDFRGKLELDRLAYEIAVREVVGYPAANGVAVEKVIPLMSAEYRDCYQWYVIDPLDARQVAIGLGVTEEVFQKSLKQYRKNDQLTSHILAPLSIGRPVTRTNYELLYPLLQAMTRGITVEVPVK